MTEDNANDEQPSIPDRVNEHDFPGLSPTRNRRYSSSRLASSNRPDDRDSGSDSNGGRSIDDLFPYESYRPHQREILEEAYECLFEQDYETVVIDAPTGIGKSGINVALARAARNAFITTPQKKLRKQLEEDNDLRGHYTVLRARDDYSCFDGETCKTCEVNRTPSLSCSRISEVTPDSPRVVVDRDMAGNPTESIDYPPGAAEMDSCTYWMNKQRAIVADRTVLTPAFLILDRHLPGPPYGFSNRDLLVVDECHGLAEAAANMWSGFSISPDSVPEDVFGVIEDDLDSVAWPYSTFAPLLERVADEARAYIDAWRPANAQANAEAASGGRSETTAEDRETERALGKCESVIGKIERCQTDVANGRAWVASVEDHYGGDQRLELYPVDVDEFLADWLWSRTGKQVLSTATLPYRADPGAWLSQIGLDLDTTRVISKPMPFPAANRPIDTTHTIDTFSNGNYTNHWSEIVSAIEGFAARHAGERGLVHTGSYDLAEQLGQRLSIPTIVHGDRYPDEWYLNQWQDPGVDADVFLSPASTDGLDLPDDMCRWQVLAKVPYGKGPRWDYKREEDSDWQWYNEMAARNIIQSAGRGVRHDEDHCTYYVLDESFWNVFEQPSDPYWMDNATLPPWFAEAIVR